MELQVSSQRHAATAAGTLRIAPLCWLLLAVCGVGAASGCLLSTRGGAFMDDAGLGPTVSDGRVSHDASWSPGNEASVLERDGGASPDSSDEEDTGVPLPDSGLRDGGAGDGGAGDGGAGDGGAGATDGGGGPQDWWDTAYGRRALVTVLHVPDADVQHAPLLVRLCEPEFPLHQALSGGQDLRFVSQGGAVLASEIETWNRNGCSFIWVRLPLLSTQSEENDFWLYFGNSAPSDVPPAPSEVWDTGFRGVWHLAEDVAVGGFGATHRDSTSQGNHGQQERNGLSSHAGAAGGAQNLTRTDDRIVIPSTGLRTTGDRFTIEVRMSPESLGPDDNIFGAGNDSNSGAEKGRYWQIYWTSGARWVARLRIEGTRRDIAAGSYDFREIDWQYLAVVYDGSRMRFFVDGVQQNSITVSGQLSAMNTDFVIGNNPILARDFQGHVDEVRISHVPRSSLYLAVTSSCLDADCTSVGSVEVRSR